MATTIPALELAPRIRSALAGLRRRIWAYIWLEGLSLAVIWVGVTFWLTLALDYFPVLVWASEMPQMARAVLLVAVAAVLGYILYRYLLSRIFVPIGDRSLAVLLERRYGDFDDALVTAVELTGQRSGGDIFSREMLAHTNRDALARVGDVRLGRVFRWRPLAWKVLVAVLLMTSMVGFYAVNATAFEIARDRIYLLSSETWPRSAEVEVVGLEIARPATTADSAEVSQFVLFDQQSAKVARGASVSLRVRASGQKKIPATCAVHYRTTDGDRGTVQMEKIGRVKDGFQHYTFDAKPFKGMLANLSFDVQGYDHRVRGYQIEVVDSPALIETNLACTFPPYMVDEATSQWLPRTMPLTPATQLPIGTQIQVECVSSKPLRAVEVTQVETGITQHLEITGNSDRFQLPVTKLTGNLTLELLLHDIDGVLSDRPERLVVTAVKDQPPQVNVRLTGIGALVTPDVAIPVSGTITDDYAVGRSWFEVHINDAPAQVFPFALQPAGKVEQTIDFRDLHSEDARFTLKPAGKLTLVVLGQDKHDLEGGRQTGYGDRWELTVVTPDELLASLEARELGLRRRFEQIITELTETRDELLRAATEKKPPATTPPAVPAVSAVAPTTNDAEISQSLRLLIAQRATQQSQKSAQEILGVAASFTDIRAELIQNRVDTEERKTRLKEQISEPLTQIVQEKFPEFDRRLEKMQAPASDPAAVAATSQAAIAQANEVLLELDAVLQRMLDLETYNELIDLVRSLIDEQEKISGETKKQQAADLLK